MISRAGRNLVERILEYISKREAATWKLTAEDTDDYRLAWWTIWFAAYQEVADPHDAALRKVLGPRYRNYRETHNTLPAVYTATAEGPHELDGRSGYQWLQSALTYLHWRSGDSWRPARDRNHPDRRLYTEASLRMRQAFNTPEQPPERFRVDTKPTHEVKTISAAPTSPLKRQAR